MLRNSLLTEEMNDALCEIERVTYMLMVANKQYRASVDSNLLDNTQHYFERKLDFLRDYNRELCEEIRTHYSQLRLIDERKCAEKKDQFQKMFLAKYPECKDNYNQLFNMGTCLYKPFNDEFVSSTEGTNVGLKPIFVAYANNIAYSLIEHQYKAFFDLFDDISNQVTEYGAKHFVEPRLSDSTRTVPSWAIMEINDYVIANKREVSSTLRKEGVKMVSLEKKLAKDPSNNALAKQYYETRTRYNNAEYLSQLVTDLSDSIKNPASRSFCLNSGWRFRDAGLLSIVDNISRFVNNVPKDILNLDEKREEMLINQSEVTDILDSSKYILETLEASLVLGEASHNPLVFGLKDYEYSKTALDYMYQTDLSNMRDRADLVKQIESGKLTPKQKEENEEIIRQIDICRSAYSSAIFHTPYGEVKYQNGKLYNMTTHQVMPIAKLDEFRYNGKKYFVKFDRDGAMLGVVKYSDVESVITKSIQNRANENGMNNGRC